MSLSPPPRRKSHSSDPDRQRCPGMSPRRTSPQRMQRSSLSTGRFRLLAGLLLLQFTLRWPQVSATTTCALDCRNGGVCRAGGVVPVSTALQGGNGVSGQYCHCPRGYWGSWCEIQVLVCETGVNGTCFSGSPCYRDIDMDGLPYYHCQCDVSGSELSSPRAIQYCQHVATTFCNQKSTNSKGGGPDVSLGPQGGSYCASGGACKPARNGTHHAGCNCPDQWKGNYCEIPVGYEAVAALLAEGNSGATPNGAASPFTSTRGYAILKGVLSGLLLFVMGIGVLALVYHGSSGGAGGWAAAWAGGYFRPSRHRPPWRGDGGDPNALRRRPPPRGRRPRRRRSRLGPSADDNNDDGSDHQPEVELALPREPFRDRAVVELSDATGDHRELA